MTFAAIGALRVKHKLSLSFLWIIIGQQILECKHGKAYKNGLQRLHNISTVSRYDR